MSETSIAFGPIASKILYEDEQLRIWDQRLGPEWALFYAGYLQTRIWDRLGNVPTRSQLVHFLVNADRAFRATGKEYMEWPDFYAKLYLKVDAES